VTPKWPIMCPYMTVFTSAFGSLIAAGRREALPQPSDTVQLTWPGGSLRIRPRYDRATFLWSYVLSGQKKARKTHSRSCAEPAPAGLAVCPEIPLSVRSGERPRERRPLDASETLGAEAWL